MKVLLAAAVLALVVSCRSTGDTPASGVAHPELTGAREHVIEGLSFGEGNRISEEHTFRLTNTGRDPIVLEDARVTTSTVLSIVVNEPRAIAPGETIDLTLRASMHGPKTMKRGRAMLTTSEGETIELVLEIRAEES